MELDCEHDKIGLHNIAALEPAEGGGWYLRRFPREVRDALSPLGRIVAQESAGVELRFVTDAPHFRVSLGSLPSVLAPYEHHGQDVLVFRGAFFHSHHRLTPGAVNHVNVTRINSPDPFETITPRMRHQGGFSHRVWRVFLGRYPAVLFGVDTYGYDRRPPIAGEVPAVRWIAYGSSITNGASPTMHTNAYIYHAARRLRFDVCNLGLSGSCLCEPRVATYLASRDDWGVMTLELGVNMRNDFTPAQFRDRAAALVDAVCSAHPGRQVVLITIYPNAQSPELAIAPDGPLTTRQEAFNTILRELAAASTYPNLTLIEGADLLDDPAGLTVDLIHPGDDGHSRMGARLAARLGAMRSLATPPAGVGPTPPHGDA